MQPGILFFVGRVDENHPHNISLERTHSRQPLVENGAETEDVGAGIKGLALGLFGRHIGGRAEDEPCLRARDLRIGLEHLRDPEVEHLDGRRTGRPGSHHDVRGLPYGRSRGDAQRRALTQSECPGE
jgi:hypothetical protein